VASGQDDRVRRNPLFERRAPAAGAQYAKSPGALYYLLLAVGPAEVVALLLWMTLRRQAGIKEALYSAGWVVLASFVLSAVAIVVGGWSGQ
jgi:hypothetical protein